MTSPAQPTGDDERILAWTKDALDLIAKIRRYEECHPKGALCLLPLDDAIAKVRLPS